MRHTKFLSIKLPWLCVSLVALSIIYSASTIAASPTNQKVWYLNQKNKIFGSCEVYICSQGLKVTFDNNKWANLAKPPNWDLLVFNPKAKIYCQTPLKDWRGARVANTFTKNVRSLNKSERICGIEAKLYEAQNLEDGSHSYSTIYSAESLGLPPQISFILCGNSATPTMKGIPLRVTHRAGNDLGRTIDTFSVKQITVSPNFFEIPAGYKKVIRPEEVMTGGISDIIEEMAR